MTVDEREAFLAGTHVGVLAIARKGKGPIAVPIWYTFRDGEVLITMSGSSVKAELLRKRGRATLTAQQEAVPYQYVMVEGPVTLVAEDFDTAEMAIRYLGPEMGKWYVANTPRTPDSVVVHLRPEQWITVDYGKVM